MLYEVLNTIVPPVAKAIWRPTVEGLENIPLEGGLLIASNHLSFVDSLVIPIIAPRRVVFLAKAEYFESPLGRAWFGGLGAVPVNRDDTKAAMDSLQLALDVLGRGEAFGIYPEGTRSRDGRLYRGRTGVAELALTAGVPVVPVGLQGTQDIQPIGHRFPRRAKVTIRFGEPIDFAGRFEGVAKGKARRVATDEVMAAIQKLSGQEAAGVYNEISASPIS